MTNEESTNAIKSQSYNEGFNNASVIEYRLRTEPILKNVELFLKGQILVTEELEDGSARLGYKTIGKRICNDHGVQQIISFIQSFLNPHAIQGNLNREMYEDLLYKIHSERAEILVSNYQVWAIAEEDLEAVIDTIMNYAVTILSRPIDNLERESYNNTIRSVESNTLKERSGGLNIWNRN